MSKSFKRVLYIIIGSISFCFGTLGIYLPVLPTVPLYLLASFCFLNSSDKLYRKFKSSKLHKKFLSRYLSAGGLTVLQKVLLIAFVSLQLGIVAFLLRSSLVLVAVIAVLYICFLASILFAVNSVLGVVGCSCFWSVKELFEQRERVRKGLFPKIPNKKQ